MKKLTKFRSESFRRNKRFSLYLSVLQYLILSFAFMLAFAQCAKNDDVLNTISEKTKVVNRTSRQAIMDEIIVNANHTPTGNVQGRSTNYSIDDAIDLLDETLNYSYCRPGTPKVDDLVLGDTITFPISPNNQVSSQDIATLFAETSLAIGNQYNHLSLSNKEAWAFAVKALGNRNGNQLSLLVTLNVSYGASTVPNTYPSPNPYEGLEYTHYSGYCGVDDPGVDGAPEYLIKYLKYFKISTGNSKYFHRQYNVGICNFGHCGGKGIGDFDFANEIHENDLNPNDPTPNDNINDYKIFFQSSNKSNYDQCLDFDVELPYYLISMSNLIDIYKPQSLVVGNIKIGADLLLGYTNATVHNMLTQYYKVDIAIDDKTQLPCNTCGL